MARDPRIESPHNTEAEEAVIGSCLIDQDAIAIVRGKLTPQSFYHAKLGMVFEVISALWMTGDAVDILTVTDALDAKGYLKDVGGTSYLTKLIEQTPTSLNAEYYAKIVKEHERRRQLADASRHIAMAAYDEKLPLDEAMRKSEDALYQVSAQDDQDEIVTSTMLMSHLYDEVEKAQARQGQIGIPTGFNQLDGILGGLHDTDMIILAARPSVGKTALALNIMYNAAMNGQVGMFVSLEMGKSGIGQRIVSLDSNIPITAIRRGTVEPENYGSFMASIDRMSRMPFIMVFGGAYSPAALRAKIKRAMALSRIDFVLVDYLQLMDSDDAMGSRQERMAAISQGIKRIAKDLEIPVVALSQLSRGLESRIDKRPILSDLRESGALEQDADVVVFLYRAEMYEPEVKQQGLTEAIVAKHRNGPTGTIYLLFRKAVNQFVSIKEEYDETTGLQMRMPVS